MHANEYDLYRDKIVHMLKANKPLWYRMEQEGIATWRYFKVVSSGEIKNPGLKKLNTIEGFLTSHTEAA